MSTENIIGKENPVNWDSKKTESKDAQFNKHNVQNAAENQSSPDFESYVSKLTSLRKQMDDFNVEVLPASSEAADSELNERLERLGLSTDSEVSQYDQQKVDAELRALNE